MRKNLMLFMIICLPVLLVEVPSLHAQWVEDGVGICVDISIYGPQIISDGAGGAIVTWTDHRIPAEGHIYAQRIDASGDVRWMTNGVAICTAQETQHSPRLASDGAGGAIITWEDDRGAGGYDIYAQRVDPNGDVQWAINGLAICAATGSQYYPEIASDGAGGAIIAWEDVRSGINWTHDIYAQRIDAGGNALWTANGVAACTTSGYQYDHKIISDGKGGAIITWVHDAIDEPWEAGIFTRRIDAGGNVLWPTGGVPIFTDTMYYQYSPELIPDGVGGAIIPWYGGSGDDDFGIRVQRVDSSGAIQWTPGGIAMCTEHTVEPAQIISDGAGGAIITWEDYRYGYPEHPDIYAQRINASGAIQWAPDGIPVCAPYGRQYSPQLTSDGAGGAIVTWQDNCSNDPDIYAQRIDENGQLLWPVIGVPICTAVDRQWIPQVTSDGAWGAIITWADERGRYTDELSGVYAMRVGPNGTTPPVHVVETPPSSYLSQNFPNPFHSCTQLFYSVSQPSHISLRVYDCSGRLVKTLISRRHEAGGYETRWDGKDGRGRSVASGVYFYQLNAGSYTETKKMILVK